MYLEMLKSLKRSNQFKRFLWNVCTLESVWKLQKKTVNTFTSFYMMQVFTEKNF